MSIFVNYLFTRIHNTNMYCSIVLIIKLLLNFGLATNIIENRRFWYAIWIECLTFSIETLKCPLSEVKMSFDLNKCMQMGTISKRYFNWINSFVKASKLRELFFLLRSVANMMKRSGYKLCLKWMFFDFRCSHKLSQKTIMFADEFPTEINDPDGLRVKKFTHLCEVVRTHLNRCLHHTTTIQPIEKTFHTEKQYIKNGLNKNAC